MGRAKGDASGATAQREATALTLAEERSVGEGGRGGEWRCLRSHRAARCNGPDPRRGTLGGGGGEGGGGTMPPEPPRSALQRP